MPFGIESSWPSISNDSKYWHNSTEWSVFAFSRTQEAVTPWHLASTRFPFLSWLIYFSLAQGFSMTPFVVRSALYQAIVPWITSGCIQKFFLLVRPIPRNVSSLFSSCSLGRCSVLQLDICYQKAADRCGVHPNRIIQCANTRRLLSYAARELV